MIEAFASQFPTCFQRYRWELIGNGYFVTVKNRGEKARSSKPSKTPKMSTVDKTVKSENCQKFYKSCMQCSMLQEVCPTDTWWSSWIFTVTRITVQCKWFLIRVFCFMYLLSMREKARQNDDCVKLKLKGSQECDEEWRWMRSNILRTPIKSHIYILGDALDVGKKNRIKAIKSKKNRIKAITDMDGQRSNSLIVSRLPLP